MEQTSKEDREKQRLERQQAYWSIVNNIDGIRHKLNSIKKHRGHSTAFKQLMLALDGFEKQIRDDQDRFRNRVRQYDNKAEIKELQKALNRERQKREELEKKITEAKESSGLFIKYVRKKLNF